MVAELTQHKVEQIAQDECATSDIDILLPAVFRLESGETLTYPKIRIRLHGDTNLPMVAVSGGISAGRKVAAANDTKGWWGQVVGGGSFVDTEKFCVLGFDFLPNVDEKAQTLTTADQALALVHVLNVLKIKRLCGFVGASYGGMVALSFAAHFPNRIGRLCVISAADKAHPAATAFRGVQRRIIEFAIAAGAPQEGVALARQLAMITYRTPEEFSERFDNTPGKSAGDLHDVCKYLVARGCRYDMDAYRYRILSDSIDRHRVDVSAVKTETLLIAAESDRLVPASDIRALAQKISAETIEIPSLYGHDAFLKEEGAFGPHLREFIERPLS